MSNGIPKNRGEASSAELKCAVRDGALAAFRREACDSDRFVICVTSFRRRLCDTDNLCPKYFIDGLRAASIIPGDNPETAFIFTLQEKVGSKEDERTEIEITKV